MGWWQGVGMLTGRQMVVVMGIYWEARFLPKTKFLNFEYKGLSKQSLSDKKPRNKQHRYKQII